MLIWGDRNFEVHRNWAYTVVLWTILFSAWFLIGFFKMGRWPSGGSTAGLTAGVIAGLIMVFEMFLWPRKTIFRAWRIGRTKYWLKAHIWLGILSLPLAMLHGGFHFGLKASPLAGILSWLTLLVVVSGLAGLYIQNLIPRIMLESLPGETIVNQIPEVLESYLREADQMIRETCGLAETDQQRQENGPDISISSSIKTTGAISGRMVHLHTTYAYIQGCDDLLDFWRNDIEPFLKPGKMKPTGLGNSRGSEVLFQSISDRLPVASKPVVERLSLICNQRRQFDRQERLHFWLHSWLVGHVALSVTLMVALFLHVVLAIEFP